MEDLPFHLKNLQRRRANQSRSSPCYIESDSSPVVKTRLNFFFKNYVYVFVSTNLVARNFRKFLAQLTRCNKMIEKSQNNGNGTRKKRNGTALSLVHRYLAKLPTECIFTTRDLLPLIQFRASLDSFLSREVKSGNLERLAWGVFRKNSRRNKMVSEERIAGLKRKAFAGKLASTENSRKALAEDIAYTGKNRDFKKRRRIYLLSLAGGSNFKIKQILWATKSRGPRLRVARSKMKAIGNRKMILGETKVGQKLRDLWLMKRKFCQRKHVMEFWNSLTRAERACVAAYKKYLPQWLTEMLPPMPTEALLILVDAPQLKKANQAKQYMKPGNRLLV